jgi:hypothetical protein
MRLKRKMVKKKIKKTNFPDLVRLPQHNHLRHFFFSLLFKTWSMIKNFYKKNEFNKDQELEILKIKLETKELELTVLRNQIQLFNSQLIKY